MRVRKPQNTSANRDARSLSSVLDSAPWVELPVFASSIQGFELAHLSEDFAAGYRATKSVPTSPSKESIFSCSIQPYLCNQFNHICAVKALQHCRFKIAEWTSIYGSERVQRAVQGSVEGVEVVGQGVAADEEEALLPELTAPDTKVPISRYCTALGNHNAGYGALECKFCRMG